MSWSMAAWPKALPNRNWTPTGISCTNISASERTRLSPPPLAGDGRGEAKGRRPDMEEKDENDTQHDRDGGAPGEQFRLCAIYRRRRQDRRHERHVESLFRHRRRRLGCGGKARGR